MKEINERKIKEADLVCRVAKCYQTVWQICLASVLGFTIYSGRHEL